MIEVDMISREATISIVRDLFFIASIGIVPWFACVSPASPLVDAGPGSLDAAAPVADTGPTVDAVESLGWVDFAITGCASGIGTEDAPCIVQSPASLRFSMLSPSMVSNQIWNFGGMEEPNSGVSPLHRFTAPGSYDISLNVEGPGGTAGVTRLAAVVVIPASLGAACAQDSHCSSGTCTCAGGENCPAGLGQGMCTLACSDAATCGDNPCINLDPLNSADAPWRQTTCLPGCDAGTPCPAGQSCQAFLGVDSELHSSCFATGLLLPLGASCRDSSGALQDGLCASGTCLDIGSRGMCSHPCTAGGCPTNFACATFADLSSPAHCLPNCEFFECASDGALSCQAPNEVFTVDDEVPNPLGYCSGSVLDPL